MNKQKYSRLLNIDGLRGWAILGVISVHSTALMAQYSSSSYHKYPFLHYIELYIERLMIFGRFGVQLFFLISGFILCYVYDQAQYSNKKFFLKRFFRLSPLYYLVLILCYSFNYNEPLETGTRVVDLNATNFILHALYIHGLFPDYLRSIFSISWSLTPEVVFYCFFPILNKLSVQKIYLVFVFSLIISYNYINISVLLFGSFNNNIPIWTQCSPINNMFVFIFGMIVYKQPLFFNSNKFAIIAFTSFSLYLIFTFFVTYYRIVLIDFIIPIDKYFLFLLPAFPYLIYSNNRVKKYLIQNKFIVLLGKISYSAFFIHWAIVAIFNNYNINFFGTNALIILLVTTYIISYFSYKCIEIPGIRIGNNIINYYCRK